MGLRHDNSATTGATSNCCGLVNNANGEQRFVANPFDDFDFERNETFIDTINAENPMRESTLEDDPLVDDYLAQQAAQRRISVEQLTDSRLLLQQRQQQQQQHQQSSSATQHSIDSSGKLSEFAVLPNGHFDHVFEARIKAELKAILKQHCRTEQIDCNDKSIYTGLPGISLLYHHLSTRGAHALDVRQADELAAKASQQLSQYLISIQLPHAHNSKCPSFYCGDLGVYALCAVARAQQRLVAADQLLTRTLSYPGTRSAPLSQSAPSTTTTTTTSAAGGTVAATAAAAVTPAIPPLATTNTAAQHQLPAAPTNAAANSLPQNTPTKAPAAAAEPTANSLLAKIVELVRMQESPGTPDELLYGRAGGLYALLLVKQQLPKQTTVKDEHITNQIHQILVSGKSMESFGRPLFYSWHGKEYVGCAHGYAGIIYMLLEAHKYLSAAQLKLVRDAINFVESTRHSPPSNNYPSSIGSQTDRLVHWCHGAPGIAHMLIKAYLVYKETALLESALACGDVVWKRGLLRKGFGLCHGIAGNAYVFLHLYQATRDLKHLYRAGKFAQFYLERRDEISWRADSPASLFEGYAGLAFFLADLLNAAEAKFPAFQLTTSSPPLFASRASRASNASLLSKQHSASTDSNGNNRNDDKKQQ